jgi:hypothetical protein
MILVVYIDVISHDISYWIISYHIHINHIIYSIVQYFIASYIVYNNRIILYIIPYHILYLSYLEYHIYRNVSYCIVYHKLYHILYIIISLQGSLKLHCYYKSSTPRVYKTLFKPAPWQDTPGVERYSGHRELQVCKFNSVSFLCPILFVYFILRLYFLGPSVDSVHAVFHTPLYRCEVPL